MSKAKMSIRGWKDFFEKAGGHLVTLVNPDDPDKGFQISIDELFAAFELRRIYQEDWSDRVKKALNSPITKL